MWILVALAAAAWLAGSATLALVLGSSIHVADRRQRDEQLSREASATR